MHDHGKGIWGKLMMVFCVLGPLAAMTLVLLSRTGVISIGGYWPYALFLLCPLSHVLMIPLMHKFAGKDKDAPAADHKPSCH